MTYTLIIPIYNEVRTLPLLLKKIDRLDDNIEIIIIDDGSNDGTKDMLIENTKLIITKNKFNLGKGASIRRGTYLASNKNVILMDGDLEVDIDDIPKLILKYEKNDIDALVGVRWKENSNNQNFDINTMGNFIINGLFNLLYKSNFKDVLCCVKIINLKLFKSLNIRSKGFSIEVETMAKLVLGGHKIEEESVKYNRRTTQEGKKLKLSDSWNIIWAIIKLRFKKDL